MAFEDEIITVDPMEIEVEIPLTTPSKAKPRSKKKAPQPTLDEIAKQNNIPINPKFLPPVPGEGLVIQDVSGGSTYDIGARFGDPLGQDFVRRRDVAPKLEVTGVRRIEGESTEAFARRANEFEVAQKALDRERRRVAEVQRAKAGSSRTSNAFIRGLGAPLTQFVEGLGIVDPKLGELAEAAKEGEQSLAPLPDDQTFFEKVVGGLGSVASGALVNALPTGRAGSAFFYGIGNAGNQFNDAKARGADDATAMTAAFDALPVGALEGLIGFESVGLKAISGLSLGQIAKGVAFESLEEGIQESASQALNNAIAKYSAGYDPQRALMEGVLESGLVGAITGGLAGGISRVPSMGEQLAIVSEARQRMKDLDAQYGVSDLGQIKVIRGGKPQVGAFAAQAPAEAKPPRSMVVDDRIKYLKGRIDRLNYMKENVPDLPPEVGEQRDALMAELQAVEESQDLDLTFDLLPGLKKGQSPSLVIPNWALAAFYGKEMTGVMGITIPPTSINIYRDRIKKYAPSPEHAQVALQAIDEAVETGRAEGVNTLAVINRDYLVTMPNAKTIPHETFHAAQGKAAEVMGMGEGNISGLHSPRWASNHPAIKKIIKEGTANHILDPRFPATDLLAVELPAYIMAGEGSQFFKTSAEAVDFLMDYFNHVIQYRGPDALNALERTAKILPEKSDVIPLIRSMYEGWVEELVAKGLYGRESADRLLQSLYPSEDVQGTAAAGSPAIASPSSIEGLSPEARDIYESEEEPTGDEPIGFAAQPPPQPTPPNVGDKVKVKGYYNEAEVMETFPDGGVKVRFPDGTEDEFDSSRVAKVTNTIPKRATVVTPITQQAATQATGVTPQSTPAKKGVVPTLPGPIRVKKSRVFANRMGPGDTPGTVKVEFGDGTVSQLPIDDVRDAAGKRIKDPIFYMLVEDPPDNATPPPNKPNNPSLPPGGPYPPLFTEGVSVGFSKAISKQFSELLENNNINYDFAKPPAVQIYESLVEGKLREEDVENVLNDENLSWEDFAEKIFETYSRAGSTLQTLSEIVQRHWQRLKKENPALFERLIAPSRQIQLMIDDLNETVLGMGLWRRSGRLLQKAILSQYGTAVNNFITSIGRVPVDATSSSIGQITRAMVEGGDRGRSWTQRMEDARQASYETFMSGFEAWRALNPRQIREIVEGRIGSEYARYEEVVSQLETYFPDIHAKLFARPLEMQAKELEKGEDKIRQMNILLFKVQNKERRRDLKQQINSLNKKFRREQSVLVKAGFRGPEYVYDQILRPMQFGEFLMRRPRFVARLGLELRDRGINLNTALRNSHMTPDQLQSLPMEDRVTFKGIPGDAVKAAVNDALEFTMALDPSTGPDARYIENVAGSFIKMMNQLGPLTMLTDIMFPRAIYSAARTFYDYSPIPFFFEWGEKGSFSRIFATKTDRDPLTGETYKVNPPSRSDYDRFGRAMVGTFLFMLAGAMLRSGMMGDEWYQLKWFGKKSKDGSPVYADIRKWIPFSRIFQLTSLADRFATGRLNDIQAGVELTDIAIGMKKYDTDPNLTDMIDATAEYWAGPERNPFKVDKVQQMAGKFPAAMLTPFLNLRSIIAQADDDENVKKDLRGYGFWGPSLDRLPWLRRQVPDMNYPTYVGKIPLSEDPGLQQFGALQLAKEPTTFLGREFQRLGLNIREYLPKDSDPVIDRRQNEVFAYLVEAITNSLESDPEYRTAPVEVQAAIWENYLMGPKSIAAISKEEGLAANPMEATRRRVMSEVPGRFTRKVLGITQQLEELRK